MPLLAPKLCSNSDGAVRWHHPLALTQAYVNNEQNNVYKSIYIFDNEIQL